MVKHTDLPLAAPQLLRLPQVLALLGMSRSWVYGEIARGAFPPPVRLGRRAVAWRLSDIERWMAEIDGDAK